MRIGVFGLIAAALLNTACGGAKHSIESGGSREGAESCARRHPGAGPAPVGAARQGSSVALARLGGATVAYVADEDDDVLRTIDVDNHTEKAITPLEGSPAQVLVLGDGRVAVTLRDRNQVQILEPPATLTDPLEKRCAAAVATEPVGLAATPDDRTLLVTSAWGRKLSAFDAASMAPRFAVDVAREPRAVVVDDAGEQAFIAHVVGAKVSVVDLAGAKHEVREIDLRARKVKNALPQRELREGCQGFALAKSVSIKNDVATPLGRIFAPMVSVDPGERQFRSSGYGAMRDDTLGVEEPVVSVIDAAAERSMSPTLLDIGRPDTPGCLLPRAAAVSERTGRLFVTCLGIDALLELDARGADPMRMPLRSVRVPAGPTGVAVDVEGRRAVVWSQFARAVAIVDTGDGGGEVPVTVVQAAAQPKSHMTPALARGRLLFHKTGDGRISRDGRACASCHPDGRDDALTWSTPEGPRQTIMLAGRLESTSPFGWSGVHRTLGVHVTETFRRLGGRGLNDQPDRFDDFDALLHYATSMRGPQVDTTAADAGWTARVRRGRELFFGAAQRCSGCHIGGAGTDKDAHDVKSGGAADRQPAFDTPSLRFVGGTAPYFHDGRYATLEALLRGSDGTMGHTMELSRRDVDALKAYLESL